jgi:hypothetical protein
MEWPHMTNVTHTSRFDEIERGLSLLIASDPVFSADGLVQHFIDVGEYGIALETAVDIYANGRDSASPEIREIVCRLAELMEMDVSELLGGFDGDASSGTLR